VGFCLTGVLVGPYGFGPIKAVHEVELLAEIGVVLLLFTIGIEFSLKRLLQIRRSILMAVHFRLANSPSFYPVPGLNMVCLPEVSIRCFWR
jgi:Kef-type K+ transport system membrane component KefB